MPPKARPTRGASASVAAPGRQSTRIAAQMEAAQHAADQTVTDVPATQPVIPAAASPPPAPPAVSNSASSDSSMPPPSLRGGRGRSRGRGEQYAQRGTRRASNTRNMGMPASIQSPPRTDTVDFLPTQSDDRGDQENAPFTMSRTLLTHD